MADSGVKIEGLKQLQSSLKEIDKDLGKLPQKVNKKAAEKVATTSKGIAPHRSGDLAASVRPTASGTSAYVRTGLVYSAVIHWGWPGHNIKPQSFMSEALDQDFDEIVDLYVDEINHVLGQLKGV